MEYIEIFMTHVYDILAQWAADLIIPLMFFFYISVWFNRHSFKASILKVLPETRFNLSIYFLDIIFVLPLVMLLFNAINNVVEIFALNIISLDFWENQNSAIVVIATIFVGDFFAYWRHRAEHSKVLWPSHVLHHSDTQMTWVTLYRIHPINRFTTVIMDFTALALMGFPEWAILVNIVVRHYYGLFIHASIPWTYGPLSYVFVSPAMHRWHHARDVTGSGNNFAIVFSVFDRAFGTYYVPGPCLAELGVKKPPPNGIVSNIIHPINIWARSIKNSVS